MLRRFRGDYSVYRCLLGIRHPNLPVIYEAIAEGDRCLVLEEYIAGQSLAEYLKTALLSERETRRIGAALCRALIVLHENGIIHRDIKPENVIVREDGGVKLIDFHTSRICGGPKSRDTAILGTVGFAAPEQYGLSSSDQRSDIYSMGILLNTMLTGEHPAARLCGGRLRNIVAKCTATASSRRYSSAEQLLMRLQL